MPCIHGLQHVQCFSATAENNPALRKPGSGYELEFLVKDRTVPAGDNVAEAMLAAGAGRIGAYEKCSYRLAGQGTFFGTDETNPAVGRKGRLERVDEIRLEMVAPKARLPEIVAAMMAAHPSRRRSSPIALLTTWPTTARGVGILGYPYCRRTAMETHCFLL